MPLLDAQLQGDPALFRRFRWAHRFGLSRLTALVAGAADPLALPQRLQLPHREPRLLEQLGRLQERLEECGVAPGVDRPLHPLPVDASGWTLLLEQHGWSAEAEALRSACGLGPRRSLLRWWARWRHLRPALTAEQLMAVGFRPGPVLGERLRQLRCVAPVCRSN